jgi:RNA polymerase sigma-70 factor (ECF subfamily)
MSEGLDGILAGCRGGDPSAQRALYERFHRMVYRLAARMNGVANAADMSQEIFLRVFRAIDSFHGSAEFSTWLYRIAINECLRRRRLRSQPMKMLIHEPASNDPEPAHCLEQGELLQKALDQLDGSLRAVFLLREVEGLSYREISAVLGMPAGTVASQMNRARRQLQAFLRRVEQGDRS